MGSCLSRHKPEGEARHSDEQQVNVNDSTDALLGRGDPSRPFPQYGPYGAILPRNNEVGVEDERTIEDEIQTRIENMTRNYTNQPNTAVILQADVRAYWDNVYLAKFYAKRHWYDRDLEQSNRMKDYRVVLSILIKTGFSRWDDFRTIFLDHPDRADSNIPFTKEELKQKDFLGTKWEMFHDAQWAFCPLVIEESSEPYELKDFDEGRRFPFIEPEKELGSGQAGIVSRQIIAAGHLIYKSPGRRSVNDLAQAVACKRVQQKQIHDVEFETMRTFRSRLWDHPRIMVNIATIIRNEGTAGRVHYLFYDLAAYDLKTFLERIDDKDPKKRHENDHLLRSSTAPKGRNNSHEWNEADLISESHRLADALDFLHHRLYHDSSYSLSHNDLKPENILVFYPDMDKPETVYPVGQWKIADFGLAKIKKASRRSKAKAVTLDADRTRHGGTLTVENLPDSKLNADLTHRRERSTSLASFRSEDMTKAKRDPGRWSAPEIEGEGEAQPDARTGDVWAFGCVLADVLAFAVKPHFVEELKRACEENSLDQRFYDFKTKETKHTAIKWLKSLHEKCDSQKFGQEWVKMTANLICDEILISDPRKRRNAEDVRDNLEFIHQRMKEEKIKREAIPGPLSLDEPPPASPLSDRADDLLQSPKDIGRSSDHMTDLSNPSTKGPTINYPPAYDQWHPHVSS